MAISECDAKRAVRYIKDIRDLREAFKRAATIEPESVTLGSFEFGDIDINCGDTLFAEAKNLFQRALLYRIQFIGSWLCDNGFEVPE